MAIAVTHRHAEVLFNDLKSRPDYSVQPTLCSGGGAIRPYRDRKDANLAVLSGDGSIVGRDDAGNEPVLPSSRRYDFEHLHGTLGEAMDFQILVDLWRTQPAIRRLYRETSNGAVPVPGGSLSPKVQDYLFHPPGEASAEDELIRLRHLFFGHGNRWSLEEIRLLGVASDPPRRADLRERTAHRGSGVRAHLQHGAEGLQEDKRDSPTGPVGFAAQDGGGADLGCPHGHQGRHGLPDHARLRGRCVAGRRRHRHVHDVHRQGLRRRRACLPGHSNVRQSARLRIPGA